MCSANENFVIFPLCWICCVCTESVPLMSTASPWLGVGQGLCTVVVKSLFTVLVFEVVCARASGAQATRNSPAAHVATSTTRRLGAGAVPLTVDRLTSIKQLRRFMAAFPSISASSCGISRSNRHVSQTDVPIPKRSNSRFVIGRQLRTLREAQAHAGLAFPSIDDHFPLAHRWWSQSLATVVPCRHAPACCVPTCSSIHCRRVQA